MKKRFTVIRQEWVESERGWGIRPDGYTLHLTIEDCEKFIKRYWAHMPDSAPDAYSRPSGEPFKARVSKRVFKELKSNRKRLRSVCKYGMAIV